MRFLLAGAILAGLCYPVVGAAQTVVLTENFEASSGTTPGGFTVLAPFATNSWSAGTAAGNGPSELGTRAAFVACPSCSSGPYRYSLTTVTVGHMYRDVTFPASGFNAAELTFDWRGLGENLLAPVDYLRVYLVPASYTPTSGTLPSGAGVEELTTLNQEANWTSIRLSLANASRLAGTTRRLLFTWRNDANSGDQPPAAIDNVRLTTYSRPQLSGTYTIDNTQATGARNFHSVAEAVEALNSGAFTGAVTFEVAAGQVFAEDLPPLTASGTAAARLTFRRAGTGANPVLRPLGSGLNRHAAIDLAGADYVTFDGIDVEATGALPLYGYRVRNLSGTNGARYNEVRNARITLNRTGRPAVPSSTPMSIGVFQATSPSDNIRGIYPGGVFPTDSLGTNRFNRYQNLLIDNANHGIWVMGRVTNQSSAGFDTDLGNEVLNVAVGTAGPGSVRATNNLDDCYGVRTADQRRLLIRGCTVQGLRAPNGYVGGIFALRITGLGPHTSRIIGNRISDLEGGANSNPNGTAGDMSGLFFSVDATSLGVTTSALQVFNNDIRDVRRLAPTSPYVDGMAGVLVGLLGPTGSSTLFYHNTVIIDGSAVPTAPNTTLYGGYGGYGGTFAMRNNLLVNLTAAQSGQIRHSVLSNMSATLLSSDYNELYLANATNGDLVRSSASHATLASWQTTGQDVHSVSLDPQLTAASPALPTNPALDDRGTPLALVPTDLLGTGRSSVTPDLGAYEFGNIVLGAQAAQLRPPLSVYPNPAGQWVRVEWPGVSTATATVLLCNAQGQTVQRVSVAAGQAAARLELGPLPAGLYVVRVVTAGRTLTRQLVKE
ncbi:T9SS type A sorting domain-containing protein [Hymenobacter sp. 15J16-1T3B]|uniref:T9SS type A sorting domain-containing protein n=1 Tax=Hymenobacter sp. 15J16-1T3B TaxID=2886941 RepID=UPI001D129894|nr:T9SS type A sorting domain-containing protein [Hymenobacter sp. 15J16-1T3B]MCC3156883.1 T9SS type A sorting domain-containing protein [Hymenobacter sp. 15J16-1T3B]